MDHDHWNDRTPATRSATGVKPIAVSLSNAPPTATPSSVMGRLRPQARKGGTVSATVLHMSEVRELREALHGS
jgi:hypothetical protein